jgi:cytoskeletal protein RodZ
MDLGSQLVDVAVVVLTGLFVTYVVRDRARHQERTLTAQMATHSAETDAQVVNHAAKTETQMATYQAKTDAQFAAVQSQLNSHGAIFAAIQSQIAASQASMDRQFASVRSDLTQIALAVGAQPRPQAG